MKQKVISRLIFIVLVVGIILTTIQTYNFRNFGVQNALNNAHSIGEVVKNGLTAHMINNNMNQRDVFLNSISNLKNVEQLWIIRGDNVIKQYGEARQNEQPRDDIDKEVIKTSKEIYIIEENLKDAKLRVTIPYKAEPTTTINCINCHDVKYGDTLGAVSMVLDISDVKMSALTMVFFTLLFTIIATILIIYFANKILKPDLETIDNLSSKIKNISHGIFTTIVPDSKLSSESKHLLKEYNSLVNDLNETFSDIDNKLNIFVGNISYETKNPIYKAQKVIGNLAEIYQFKKEVELDSSKEDIYNRLAQILISKFDQKNFIFMEQEHKTNFATVVYSYGDNNNSCINHIQNEATLCRATRSSTDVFGIDGQKICPFYESDKSEYYCFSIDIGEYRKLIINFTLDNKDELENLKRNIPLIKNYMLEATPSIIVKLLLKELKDSAFKDGLTRLYNRKFLDAHITKLIPQALREEFNIGVLMLDMDHFKSVNDEHGHDVGDIVLQELSRILLENVRDSDIVVRYGGEEFIILLVGVQDENAALNVANKIREQVYLNEIDIPGSKLRKTVSIGLSMFPEDTQNFNLSMKNADIALYEAKNSGRNRVIRYNKEDNES